jgi:tetratricopeptide (TPR) repeat protein
MQLQVTTAWYLTERTRGSAYAALRPDRAFVSLNPWEGMAGGGYIYSWDVIEAQVRTTSDLGSAFPSARAAYGTLAASIVLGDPEGVAQDLSAAQGSVRGAEVLSQYTGAESAANIVSNPTNIRNADESTIYMAISRLQSAGMNRQAAAICRTTGDLRCLGEASYLAGDYQTARQAFADSGDLLHEGFLAEVMGDRDAAIRLYEKFLAEVQGDMKWMWSDIVTARLADVYLDHGNAEKAMELYDQVIEHQEQIQTSDKKTEDPMLQHVRNNRGIALLTSQTDAGQAPDCLGEAAAACADALDGCEAALRSDPHNPVYLLGKGWVERLQGKNDAATHALSMAADVDPRIFPGVFPALNDLGVLAANSGDTDGARQAFRGAIASNPHYSLALWNLGVLEMHEGIGGIPSGQAYLARAIALDSSLKSANPSYRFDNIVYRIEFNERSGTGWSFGASFSAATALVGLIAALAMILDATNSILKEKVQELVNTWTSLTGEWFRTALGRQPSLPMGDGWARWLPLVITLPVLAFVTAWPALHGDPGTAIAVAMLMLFAALTAVITHELGHALAARWWRAQLRPAQWGLGTFLALALALLPGGLSAGPFPGERIDGDDEKAVAKVYLAGPIANLLVALAAIVLFSLQPLPALRLIVIAQFAAMGFALLPFAPLDGSVLARSWPRPAQGLAFLASLAGVLFGVGLL